MNGFEQAAALIERRAGLGRQVWAAGELRCYEKQDGPVARLTLTRDSFPVLVSEYVGADLDALK